MRADNEIYDRLAESWWAEEGVLGILRTAVNPARSAYFQGVLAEHLREAPPGTRGLDLGCGGGILSEDLALAGFAMTGIDRSPATLAAARAHASAGGLAIRYLRGAAEALPFPAAHFDFVCCCDVLEHVSDVGRVLVEAARVLRPGGLFLYDTVNRTLRSRLVAIGFAQKWRWSRFLPENVHAWGQFIRPAELTGLLGRCGIAHRELTGMAPAAHPLRIALLARRLHRGRIPFSQFGQALRYRLTDDTSVSYLGYGVRTV